jgi:hypothetical protein
MCGESFEDLVGGLGPGERSWIVALQAWMSRVRGPAGSCAPRRSCLSVSSAVRRRPNRANSRYELKAPCSAPYDLAGESFLIDYGASGAVPARPFEALRDVGEEMGERFPPVGREVRVAVDERLDAASGFAGAEVGEQGA